jgi:hypothetical protein
MSPREARAGETPLRCDHCGRAVRETQHTRTAYAVDFYTLYSGHGERCTVAGDDRQRAFTYVKLLDRFDVITCADCYRDTAVQAARDRQFQPERETDGSAGEES